MKKLMLLATTAIFWTGVSLAAVDGAPTQLPVTATDRSESEMTSELQKLGYTNVDDVRLSGAIYTAWAHWDGEPVALRIDQKTGHIQFTSSSDTETIASMVDRSKEDLVSDLEGLGYNNVHDVMKAGSIFRATADRDGMTYRLRVDSETGVVTSAADRTEPTVGFASSMSDDEIVNALAKMGYKNGEVTAREGNVISAKAHHMDKAVDLNIDARTGTVKVVN